ncbi:MAG: glycosyltransferase family 9 protein [Dissulfurimicrobium sp.]|uniref:glycosyltransferase family 9 protein n=1 Tax=Dissulfurimicrobium sp. TaxID=2022436 RepID=UPI0040491EF8
MRILIVKLSAIGDVVQSLPVLAALRAEFPEAHIGWVVGEAAAGLLESHPMLDEIIIFPRRGLGALISNPSGWPAFFSEIVAFLKRLRAMDYDFVIDLQGLFKSGFITFFSRARAKVGFANGRELSSIFLNTRLPAYDPDEHAVLRYMRIASYLGAKIDKPMFPTGVLDKDREQLDALLRGVGVQDAPIMCMVPGAAWSSKRWTSQGFSEIADYCTDKLDLVPIIVGGRGDRWLAREIVSFARRRIIDLTGQTNLKMLAALFERSKVTVSTDTGPMHLAAATGSPVVALFGPTAPWRTGPFGEQHQVLRCQMSCSPCFRRSCPDPRCMTGIMPLEVIAAVSSVVKKQGVLKD